MPPEVQELVYQPRNQMRRLFKWIDGVEKPPREALLVGAAGTGKTRACGEMHYELCERFANTRILVTRKYRQDLREGWQKTFERNVLYPGHYLLTQEGYGKGDHRTKYVFRNGSEIVLGHMDDPERWYSSEWDIVFWNEAVESKPDQWEKLGRSLRVGTRPTKCPFRMLMGDTNPGSPRHHLKERIDKGRTELIQTSHRDNPSLEADYLERLAAMSGVTRRRLFLGEWCQAEGLILDVYDDTRHVIGPDALPGRWAYTVAGMDFGYENPGSIVVLGYGEDGVPRVIHEVYRRKKGLDWWAAVVADVVNEYDPVRVIADSAEPRTIQFLNDRLSEPIVAPVSKAKQGGKTWGEATRNHLRTLLENDQLFFLDDARRLRGGPDPRIESGPRCLTDEIAEWQYKPVRSGAVQNVDAREEPDPECHDHSIDALIYALTWAWGKDFTPDPEDAGLPDDRLGAILGVDEVMAESFDSYESSYDYAPEHAFTKRRY